MPKRSKGGYVVVLVTCGSLGEAHLIGRSIVKQRLAACVNIFETPVQSVYRWAGKIQRAREFVLMIKSPRKRLAGIRAEVERLHSYDVPEIIAVAIATGSPKYLKWLDVETSSKA